MAIVLTFNPIIEKIVDAVELLSEEERNILLAQLNAGIALKNPDKYNIIKKPVNVSMKQIDKWKHESRKYAK